ncbi:MAG: SpoIIE family protein phosphatase [Candidatus Hinthialibacter antarcticus]|nr:SpoIIE family protein phosphatase [Candidatus Hinthialibacter antarcticus]
MTQTEERHSALIAERPVTVLLVDDQPMVGEAVRRMLEGDAEIQFHYCSDPSQAIPTAETISPTVILQDLVMPEIDGLTLLKYYRANAATRDVPVIVLSTKEEPKIKAEAFGFGANDYLVKLPDKIELIARIRSHSNAYVHMLQRNEAYQKLEEELSDAADYVKSLLPPPLTEGMIQTHWRFIPSTQLGGDAFGYHWLDDDHFALYLLDVVGHGVGAALLSVSIMNALRSATLPNVDFHNPGEVLNALNLTFPMDQQNGLIFTMWYGVLNRANHELVYASGGHPPALLYQPNQEPPDRLDSTGVIIGALARAQFETKRRTIQPGARLLLFSDGVYEVFKPNGSMMSFSDFVEITQESITSDESCLDAIQNTIQSLRGLDYFDDDYSMVEFMFADE